MMKVPEFQAAMERTGVERKCYTTDEVATMLGISTTTTTSSSREAVVSRWNRTSSARVCGS